MSDVNKGGALHQKKAFRHSSTHRFTVLHDIGCTPSRNSIHVEHSGVEEFKSLLIESLQLARAAILYFVEMIAINEVKMPKGGGNATRRSESSFNSWGRSETFTRCAP